MAKKSKIAKYRSRRTSRKENPDVGILYDLSAGFGGYALTRLFARIVYSQAVKRLPKLAGHIHFVASALGAAGVYFGSKYWNRVSEHHESATVGAGIALLQTGIQTYMPKMGWIVSDVSPEQYIEAKSKTEQKPNGSEAMFDVEAMFAGDEDLAAMSLDTTSADQDEMPGDLEEPLLGTGNDDGNDLLASSGMLQ